MRMRGKKLLSLLLTLVMVLSLVPMTVYADETSTATFTKVTSADELTTGRYVMVTSTGYAPGKLDGSWVTAVQPTVTEDDTIVDPTDGVWTLTVEGTSVKLTDADGTSIAPKGGDNNGIKSGEYSWEVTFADGTFTFAGTGNDTVTFASNVSSSNKFRAYKNETIAKQPGGYPSDFTLYKLNTEPARESGIVTDLTTLQDGDSVVVFNPAYNKALSATTSATYYRAGVDVELTEGALSGYGDTELWTLGITVDDEDNSIYTFSTSAGNKLSMGTQYTSIPLDDVNTTWSIESADTEDCFYIENVNRSAYLEWYNDRNNWSSYYSISERNEALFAQQLYLVIEDEGTDTPVDPVDPVDPVEPAGSAYTLTGSIAEGDTVVMYNASSGTLLSSTASGYKLAGVSATPAEDVITTEDTTVAWVVGKDADGNYTFTQGDLVLGVVKSGSYVNLSTNASDGYTAWTLESSTTDNVFYVKNTNMPASNYGQYYIEYYSGYTAYASSSPSDNAFGISFYKLDSSTEEPEPTTGPIKDGDKVVIYNPANMMALSTEYSGYYNKGVAVTLDGTVLSGYAEADIWTVGVDANGNYTFSASDGSHLSMDTNYTSMPLGKANDTWSVTAIEEEDTYFIENVGRAGYRIQYQSSYTTWSAYNNNTTGDAYKQAFYVIDGETTEPVDPVDPVDPIEPGETGKLTSADQLTSGYYVMVVSTGYAPSVLEGNWVLCTQPTISGDQVTDAKGSVWTLNVTDDTVTLTDSNGTPIAPKGGNNNGIQSGTYEWEWSFDESTQTFRFLGTGSDTVTLASNNNMDATYGGFNKFKAYKNTTVSSNDYPCDFTLYRVEGVMPDSGLPEAGSKVVIYNQNAKAVLAEESDTQSINKALATITEGVATEVENGGVVFTVEKNGDYYRFKNERYGYLCSNGTGNNAFYSKDFSEEGVSTEDADWLVRTCSGGVGGYEMESRTAKYNGTYSQWLEYYSDSFKTYSMYKVTDYTIYSFYFYPVADGIKTEQDVVNDPKVVFTSADTVMKGQDYTLTFYLDDINTIDDKNIKVSDQLGNSYAFAHTEDGYTATIPAVRTYEAYSGVLTLGVEVGQYSSENYYEGTHTVTIVDEPSIGAVTPAANSQTGEDKKPVISAEIINAGENPTITMTVNSEAVEATYADGKLTYTPTADMADGRTNVTVTVTRTDGKTVSKAWSFTVGETTYQLYFGQLHSHTQYSDGSGTLESALGYVSNLPANANVQFVAFTDHSNYFDGSKTSAGTANPEGALYDMSLASTDSQNLWNSYKSAVAAFNEENAGTIVALAGFEMTWSGGPGHINTFNTPGIVSRNNTTLNNKTSDAGMKAYYALLSQEEGINSISQFNHPGSTFGTFSDFSYWDAVIDSRMYMVEVGNGEGQIGAGGYYPSYEYYTMALDKGWHLAPTNNQDNHKGKWGNANDARDVILTDNFIEEGIYEAIRNYRLYATEDKNLEITYTVNDLQMGSIISTEDMPEKLDFNVTVYDPDDSDSIAKVELVVNSGKVAYTWDDPAVLANGELSVTLDPTYSYYFVRVTQGDGDLAVTAPVWVGESLKLGISSVECGTSTPVTDEELTITTTLFNSESSEAAIKSVTYTVGDTVLEGTKAGATVVPASGTATVTFTYTPTVAKIMTVTATVVLTLEGEDYTFTMDVELDVQDASKLVYIGIDASHYNEYVAGNYADSMGNFSNLAAEYGIRTVELKTSEELIAACSNDKYVALIMTAPSRRLAAAQNDIKVYTADEIAAIKAFNAAGGTVIMAGWSDHYEYYPEALDMTPDQHMAATQNAVLEALGSSIRISDDATYDDVRSKADGVDAWRLYFNTYGENFLTEGVEVDAEHPYDRLYTEVFSHYGGASIYTVDGTLPATVSPVVYGHSTTYSKDVDKDGLGGDSTPKYAYAEGDERLLIMASEQLEGQGLIIVSGAAFMSNFEVQATIEDNGSEKNYSNYKICENLLAYLNPVTITDIADVQAEKEEGVKFTIEGIVTSNASGYDADTAFFDCIYVQDDTAGINAFPVAGSYKIGDVVRITGTTSSYQGERQIAVTSIEKLDETTPVEPKAVTADQLENQGYLGSLVTVEGTATKIEYANGLIQTIMVKDATGKEARIFIDGYITTDEDVKNAEVGCHVVATGLASYDNTFTLEDGTPVYQRIRIRDRADVVCSEETEPEVPSVPSTPLEPAIPTPSKPSKPSTPGKPGTSDEDKKDDKPIIDVYVPEMPFDDVLDTDWFYDDVLFVYEKGIMSGTGANTFDPNSPVTRGMIVTILYRMQNSPAVSGTCAFTDVDVNQWYGSAVVWAAENGIVTGYDATTFGPNDPVTREQLAAILYRYAVFCGMDAVTLAEHLGGFSDVGDISSYAVSAMNWAVGQGLINGSNGKLLPKDQATRAQVAAIIRRYLEG